MLFKLIAGGILLYVCYCGLLFLMQRQMMFPRGQVAVPAPRVDEFPGIEKTHLNTRSGKIDCWFMPPELAAADKRAPAVIFAHGNGELIDFWPQALASFNRLGIGVLLVEYPGYGRSEGRPSQAAIADAFVKAYDTLIGRRDVDPSRIVLFGRSIGGGAVCDLARSRPSAAMILMSTFTSARSFAVRFLAPGFLVRDPFDNLKVVQTYPRPLLIIHGRYDEVIPYAHGQLLYQAAGNAEMITYESGHNDCPPDWDRFWADIEKYLRGGGIIRCP